MRLRPSSVLSAARNTKSSLKDSTNGLSLTNNHKANNLNINHNLNNSNTSNTFDERDNTPR